ncbi:CheW-like domain-containing-protein [Desulfonema limicola]|uniref:CheW-like domain-containing-protein n=1 Tax=Desulfonema limicola TaxID=45656 RepID=A0A975B9A9_9BACT|nr:chemotaxis protein CheW [Desulfonema limicola]QTA81113.1 CheW-like domain-containing-protein [Desulfonema limicola]
MNIQGIKEKDFFDDDIYDEEDDDTMKDKYLTFYLGNEVYGIDIYHVIEIVGIQKITEIPDMPDYVKGVINLRGQVIPVMDVRIRFNMPPLQYNDRTCVIVTCMENEHIGLVVDIVEEVVSIPEHDISAPPKVGQKKSKEYIKGMGKTGSDVKIILDVNKLLFEEQIHELTRHLEKQ